MALRLWTLCLFLGSAYAQSGMMESAPTILETSRPLSERAELEAVQGRYETSTADAARRNHFFCVTRNTTTVGNTVQVRFNTFEGNSSLVFSLWFQYPLLAYLDTYRKQLLMNTIVEVLNVGSTAEDVQIGNLCLGTYEIYGANTFNEGVLMRIYGREQPINGYNMATRFRTNMGSLTITYPGQPGVRAFNLSEVENVQGEPLHPGSRSSDGVDPTLYPVLIGVYPGNVSLTGSNAVRSMYPFAVNPNPINYYLEAGDYVFAVIGTILLVGVQALCILGYCIHPFFLA